MTKELEQKSNVVKNQFLEASKKKEPESSQKKIKRSVTPIKLIMNCSAKKMMNGKI